MIIYCNPRGSTPGGSTPELTVDVKEEISSKFEVVEEPSQTLQADGTWKQFTAKLLAVTDERIARAIARQADSWNVSKTSTLNRKHIYFRVG